MNTKNYSSEDAKIRFKEILDIVQKRNPIAESKESPAYTTSNEPLPKFEGDEDKFKEVTTEKVQFLLELDINVNMGYNLQDLGYQILDYISTGIELEQDSYLAPINSIIKKLYITPFNLYSMDTQFVVLSENNVKELEFKYL